MRSEISTSRSGSIDEYSDSIVYIQHPIYPNVPEKNTYAEKKDSEDSWSQGEDQDTSIEMDPVNPKIPTDPMKSAKESHANWSDDESDANPPGHRDIVTSVPLGISVSKSDNSSSNSVAMVAASTMASSVPNNLTSITQTGNLPQRGQLNPCHSRFDTKDLICNVMTTTFSAGVLAWGIYELLSAANLAPPITIGGMGAGQGSNTIIGAFATTSGALLLLFSGHWWKLQMEAATAS